jgi:hypothetical protein
MVPGSESRMTPQHSAVVVSYEPGPTGNALPAKSSNLCACKLPQEDIGERVLNRL